MSKNPADPGILRKRLVLFIAFIALAFAAFAAFEWSQIQARQRRGAQAFENLYSRRLATSRFRVSEAAQQEFLRAIAAHGEPDQHRLRSSTYTLGSPQIRVEGFTRRRTVWFLDRFTLGEKTAVIENYTCTPLLLSDEAFTSKYGLP